MPSLADDLARALVLLLDHPAPPPSLNCSDLILDRHDLLALLDSRNPPPLRADRSSLRVPDCRGLMLAGWRPGGMALLRSTLPAMLDAAADL